MTADSMISRDMVPDEWAALPADPDLERDLGYELLDLEVIEVPISKEMVFLPSEEDMLKDEAFIIAPQRLICDAIEHR